ncbi:hypothetical protein H696_00568 [Fonticula alba]|uniref:Phosphatidic acid phosphatase type 2/haloperoxidase domain-containing protein n=1 Tax=Fonticula alba TaxID=691883 RepID=A0A058ZGG4_FONAL|nr:hypothetical protein H696_00568 [Fonticula alba]KCV73018.1 hypothetical protein H696_00568 [Fonticula alba]|eukprot:XP_009492719.1 hypothetical protein H696_00568 [Fonticula alba]
MTPRPGAVRRLLAVCQDLLTVPGTDPCLWALGGRGRGACTGGMCRAACLLLAPFSAVPPFIVIAHVAAIGVGLLSGWARASPGAGPAGLTATPVAEARLAGQLLSHLGFWVCEVLAQVLKRLVRQARPVSLASGPVPLASGHGWPSSHTQFMVFCLAYFGCLLVAAGDPGVPASGRRLAACPEAGPLARLLLPPGTSGHAKVALTGLLAALTLLVAIQRLAFQRHFPHQVLAGAWVGLALAIGWLWVVSRPAAWDPALRLARWLLSLPGVLLGPGRLSALGPEPAAATTRADL